MAQHRIIIGDARSMRELADESVHLIVTSPPYWQLKDYGDARQIGYHHSYEDYVNQLNLVWAECGRVLHPGCRLCVNIGDQFARSAYYGRYKVIPIRTEVIRFCEAIGLDYMGAIIWQKVTTCNTTGGATVMGSFPYPRNGIVKLDYEFILLFKKPGKGPAVTAEAKRASALSPQEWNEYFYGHWNFPGERAAGHLAPFPEELPKRLIRMFSFVGETVLDPFLGSGTTTLAAMKTGRSSVGYEVNAEYEAVIRRRLEGAGDLFEEKPRITYERQVLLDVDFEEALARLPYVFRDPVRLSRRVDPKERRFGSKIDGRETGEEETFRVADVIAPDEILLCDGRRVGLVGVMPIAERESEAVSLLREFVLGRRVVLRAEEAAVVDGERLLCYVYLENRMLVNAKMIKAGVVAADRAGEYRMKRRFVFYEESTAGRPVATPGGKGSD